MIDREILSNAIDKAIANGWETYVIGTWITKYIKTVDLVEKAVYDMVVRGIIFSHSFAKAFWNTTTIVPIPCPDDKPGCLVYHYKEIEDWKHHLQQLVLEEEPIAYLEKFL